jgi:hypothetical protein
VTRAGIELETGFALVGARQSSVYTATLSPHTLELEQTHGEFVNLDKCALLRIITYCEAVSRIFSLYVKTLQLLYRNRRWSPHDLTLTDD